MNKFVPGFRPHGSPPTWRFAVAAVCATSLTACVVAPVHRRAPPPPPQQVFEPTLPVTYFYPGQGQSPERQDRDRYECYRWARMQTGQDPGMRPVVRPVEELPGPPRPGPPPGAGAAVGAVTGAVIGAAAASPRHAGEGMVLGAVIGTLIGAASDNQRAVDQAQADSARARRVRPVRPQALEGFRRAMSACMSARGYTIG